MISDTKTREEIIADFLSGLVRAMGDEMLKGINSGVEDIYTAYVKQLSVEEGSY